MGGRAGNTVILSAVGDMSACEVGANQSGLSVVIAPARTYLLSKGGTSHWRSRSEATKQSRRKNKNKQVSYVNIIFHFISFHFISFHYSLYMPSPVHGGGVGEGEFLLNFQSKKARCTKVKRFWENESIIGRVEV